LNGAPLAGVGAVERLPLAGEDGDDGFAFHDRRSASCRRRSSGKGGSATPATACPFTTAALRKRSVAE